MARETLASLRSANEALRTENSALRAELAALRPSPWRKNAATLFINDVPRATFFTHSAAYQAMRKCREAGLRSMYAPVRA